MRPPTIGDAAAIWSLARTCGLDLNSPYAYLLVSRDFATSSLVAEGPDGALIGFVSAYRPPERPDVLFVWQIAVAESARGRGTGVDLLCAVLDHAEGGGELRFLEATVTPSNDASRQMFRRLAERRTAPMHEAVAFHADAFPDPTPGEDPHEDEILVRIGPLGAADARAPTPVPSHTSTSLTTANQGTSTT